MYAIITLKYLPVSMDTEITIESIHGRRIEYVYQSGLINSKLGYSTPDTVMSSYRIIAHALYNLYPENKDIEFVEFYDQVCPALHLINAITYIIHDEKGSLL